jgi:Ni2+-binding GTPase involved in maturation of urease and hydrogenase
MVGLCTILIGASGSGKTKMVSELLYRFKDRVPSVIVFCPTNDQNQAYTNIVPDSAIIRELGGGRLISKITRIFKR